MTSAVLYISPKIGDTTSLIYTFLFTFKSMFIAIVDCIEVFNGYLSYNINYN